MLSSFVASAVVLGAALAPAGAPSRVYVVQWAGAAAAQDVLTQELDRALKDELARRGGAVVSRPRAGAIVLSARLEVLPRGLRLEVLGLRGADRAVLGSISTKASGASRAAQVRAVARRVGAEAALLH